MERQCGDTDQLLKENPNLGTVSRGSIVKQTKEIWENDSTREFRKMELMVKILD